MHANVWMPDKQLWVPHSAAAMADSHNPLSSRQSSSEVTLTRVFSASSAVSINFVLGVPSRRIEGFQVSCQIAGKERLTPHSCRIHGSAHRCASIGGVPAQQLHS
jgi:hypothetical protein